MKISIITPTFNAAEHVEPCIDSVLSQTCQNWEHIVIDGGSTDGTLGKLHIYKHLRWVSGPDRGIYDAMNKGVRLAEGDWLYFLGADDVLHDDNVLCEASNCFGGYDVVYGNVFSTRFGGLYNGEFTMEGIFSKNICHQAIFFRKNVFKRVGVFNLNYQSHADWEHNFRWFLHPNIRKRYCEMTVANYADHGYSSMNPDIVFDRDKLYRYLICGFRVLPKAKSILYSKQLIIRYLKEKKMLRLLKCIIIYWRIIIAS